MNLRVQVELHSDAGLRGHGWSGCGSAPLPDGPGLLGLRSPAERSPVSSLTTTAAVSCYLPCCQNVSPKQFNDTLICVPNLLLFTNQTPTFVRNVHKTRDS